MADFTTNEMNHLFNEAWSSGASYSDFMKMLIKAAGYKDGKTASGKDRKAADQAKDRFHRWRHDLKKKGVQVPALSGAPNHRLTGEEIVAQFEWAKSSD